MGYFMTFSKLPTAPYGRVVVTLMAKGLGTPSSIYPMNI